MERKELTKERAIELHRSMWMWIAREIARNKKPMEICNLKIMYIDCYTDFDFVTFVCFACEYADQKLEYEIKKEHECSRCKFCPLEWGTSGNENGNLMCEDNRTYDGQGYGLYAKCRDVLNESFGIGNKKDLYKRQAKLAYKIAMLPEKKDD